MYHRLHPIAPTQQATNGALDIFVTGFRQDNVRDMLIGLSVLSSATEAQVHEAMTFVQTSRHISTDEMQSMLAR